MVIKLRKNMYSLFNVVIAEKYLYIIMEQKFRNVTVTCIKHPERNKYQNVAVAIINGPGTFRVYSLPHWETG